MKNNLYVNGNVRHYGATFTDSPYETMRLHLSTGDDGDYERSGEFNLVQGDVFKVTGPGWEKTMSYWNLKNREENHRFAPVWDGHDGDNIRCTESGRYKITVHSGGKLHIDYLGKPKENDCALWQIAGELTNYDSHWGTGSDALHLHWLADYTAYDPDYPMELYDCYRTKKPVFLESGDEFKIAIIDNGTWVKAAGASLLDSHDPRYVIDDDFLEWGENVGGANIRVNKPGKYYFYLYVSRPKKNPRDENYDLPRKNYDEFRIVWKYDEGYTG